ncbi:MAG TPA: DUF2784 domain-containing protein [Pirellulales bacterium]|jgi:hypothetical protein|nr:DUF2784 domain-containing protein [Pirellulales bacterium]
MGYSLLADLVVVVHLAYVAFVVLGQVAICAGAVWRWSWVGNPRFRVAHLAAIVLVALESLLGIVCPLTRWENQLRELAGETAAEESFVARGVHAVLFYHWPESVFTTIYVAFAAAVALTLWLVPPRWRRSTGD